MWEGCHSIFSNAPVGADATDSVNVLSSALKLGPLAYNGGSTQTMAPLKGSIAINSGDPTDKTNAQNGAILRNRDRGAAEYYCVASKPEVVAAAGGLTTTATGTYQWLDCDNGKAVVAGATSKVFEPSANGNYSVVVDDGVCSDTSDCINVNTVGITSSTINSAAVSVKLYPNPSKGSITLELHSSEQATVVVYNSLGKQIDRFEMETATKALNLAGEKGVYLVRVQTNSYTQTLRVLKQ